MNKYLSLTALLLTVYTLQGQSVQSVNSANIQNTQSVISVGEIVINPSNLQSSTGTIAIALQINQQLLEVTEVEISPTVTAFPNPTSDAIEFKTSQTLNGEMIRVFNLAGQTVLEQKLTETNQLNISNLSAGTYLVRFDNSKFKTFNIIKK
ncbi:MAG: T9SS type A sorting domain-containing protein [Flavobacteriaceae bacterium]